MEVLDDIMEVPEDASYFFSFCVWLKLAQNRLLNTRKKKFYYIRVDTKYYNKFFFSVLIFMKSPKSLQNLVIQN